MTKRVCLVTSNQAYGDKLCAVINNEGSFTAETESPNALKDLDGYDAIILDAHAERPRSCCEAVRVVRRLRQKGIGTPFVILTWLDALDEIVIPQFTRNPFVGHHFRESCRFMQLPVSAEELMRTLDEVESCTSEEINLGKRFLNDIETAHRVSVD